jgi:hypothetical protein
VVDGTTRGLNIWGFLEQLYLKNFLIDDVTSFKKLRKHRRVKNRSKRGLKGV